MTVKESVRKRLDLQALPDDGQFPRGEFASVVSGADHAFDPLSPGEVADYKQLDFNEVSPGLEPEVTPFGFQSEVVLDYLKSRHRSTWELFQMTSVFRIAKGLIGYPDHCGEVERELRTIELIDIWRHGLDEHLGAKEAREFVGRLGGMTLHQRMQRDAGYRAVREPGVNLDEAIKSYCYEAVEDQERADRLAARIGWMTELEWLLLTDLVRVGTVIDKVTRPEFNPAKESDWWTLVWHDLINLQGRESLKNVKTGQFPNHQNQEAWLALKRCLGGQLPMPFRFPLTSYQDWIGLPPYLKDYVFRDWDGLVHGQGLEDVDSAAALEAVARSRIRFATDQFKEAGRETASWGKDFQLACFDLWNGTIQQRNGFSELRDLFTALWGEEIEELVAIADGPLPDAENRKRLFSSFARPVREAVEMFTVAPDQPRTHPVKDIINLCREVLGVHIELDVTDELAQNRLTRMLMILGREITSPMLNPAKQVVIPEVVFNGGRLDGAVLPAEYRGFTTVEESLNAVDRDATYHYPDLTEVLGMIWGNHRLILIELKLYVRAEPNPRSPNDRDLNSIKAAVAGQTLDGGLENVTFKLFQMTPWQRKVTECNLKMLAEADLECLASY